MGKIADLFFQAMLDDKRLQLDAKKSGDKAGATMGSSMAAGIKKSWSGEQLGKGLVQGLGFAGALGAANLLSSGINLVTDSIGRAIEAAKEEEASIAKLGAALKANVASWDGNTEAIEKTLAARMRLGFADDEQRDSLALLVAATHDANKALELQSVAMDLARLKGISLKEASEALVKVEGGQFRLLKSLGIVLKDGATQTEALAAVTKVAAGQAEAYAKTSGGKMLAAQIKMDEALEKLGTELLPLVAEGLVVAADAVTAILEPIVSVAAALGPFVTAVAEAKVGLEDFADSVPGLVGTLNLVKTVVTLPVQPLFFLKDRLDDVTAVAPKAGVAMTGFTRAADEAALGIGALASTSKTLVDDFKRVGTATGELSQMLGWAIGHADWDKKARRAANLAAGAVADGINEKRDTVDQAWQDLLDGLENAMSVTGETARLLGHLASKELIAGMKSADPAVRAQAAETKQIILDRLAELKPRAGTLSKEAWAELRKAMKSADPDIRSAARGIYDAATAPLAQIPPKAKTYGRKTGEAYAAGLRSTYGLVHDAAIYVGRGAVGPMKASSPPGPESPLHLIDRWGANTMQAWIDGIGSKTSAAVAAMRHVSLAAASGLMAPTGLGANIALPMAAAMPGLPAGATTNVGGATFITNNTANVTGLVKATDPLSIARQLSRFAGSRDPMDLQRERLR